MSKVLFNEKANKDLIEIVSGLMTWKVYNFDREQAIKYKDSIVAAARKLETKKRHTKCSYERHLLYGSYVYKYNRNKMTTWYIIYNIDEINHYILIEKIMSNHQTDR